ncbi:MAG: helix-turn-helix transcriptional regulator [Lachnospiraceae bacterium]|nr:helix-turn-helix transcriptional regulator [Lachnospiraceae bacterium]
MDYFNIKSLPEVHFAHSYDADSYSNLMRKQNRTMEISYIKEGELQVTRDGIQTVAHTGDIICTPFRSDARIYTSHYHCHHTVCATADFIYHDAPTDESLFLSPIISSPNHGKFEELIDKLIYVKKVWPERRLKCSGLFLQLLDELSEECKRNMSGDGHGGFSYIRKAKKYIYDNINRRITQKEVAAYLGITPEYLCSVFKKYTGESMIQFINNRKLENICILMKKEGIPLYRAAEMYGFTDPNYVSRLYRRYHGISITDDAGTKSNSIPI